MSGLFRVVADQMLPVPEVGRSTPNQLVTAHAAPEATASDRGAARTDDLDQAPVPATANGRVRPVTVNRLDLRRRLPALESWTRTVENVDVAAVWAMVHHTDGIGAMVRPGSDGRPHIFINLVHGICPVRRLGLVAHEAEHWRRGDCRPSSPSAWDPLSEMVCEAAAADRMADACEVVDRKTRDASTPSIDASVCVRCYDDVSPTCRQPSEVLARILDVLNLY